MLNKAQNYSRISQIKKFVRNQDISNLYEVNKSQIKLKEYGSVTEQLSQNDLLLRQRSKSVSYQQEISKIID